MNINQYKVWCNTDSKWEYVWLEDTPTVCPSNIGHTIDTAKTAILKTVSEDLVHISNAEDEFGRPFVRTESRDNHDTTYFTTQGDKWISVSGEAVGIGDGTTSAFSLDNMEVRNVSAYVDGTYTSGITVDYSTYPDYNESDHFCRGLVTFDIAPISGEVITASYEYCDIAGDADNTLVFDFTTDNSPKTVDIVFCDPVHIKDGVLFYEGGALDAKVDLYVLAPGPTYYQDNNGDYRLTTEDKIVSHYVVNHRMIGSAPHGHLFNVETRSVPLPSGYKIRLVFDKGSATDLSGFVQLEINRQRTHII
jgi:hypothetical protein